MTETEMAWWQIALAWLFWVLGSITLAGTGVAIAALFTLLQIIVLLRDRFGLFKWLVQAKETK